MPSAQHHAGPTRASSAPVRISAIYAALGLLWVLLSDALLAGDVPSIEAWISWQTLKASVYVLATAVLLYLLIRRDIRRIQASEKALTESEQHLRESQEMLRLLFERATDAINIAEYDPKTYTRWLVQCNDRYVQMSGYSRQELFASRNLNALTTYPHRVEERRQWAHCIEAGVPFHGLGSWKRPDGRENWYEWTATPIRRGDRLLILGVDRDVTERRQAEDERERLKQQLLQAQKLEAIGTLAGGVAHDFNNLLTGIIGYANLLRTEAPPGSDVHQSAQAIESAARRGGQLTAQLLAFARKSRRENVPVDLHEAIGDASSLLRRTLGENIAIHQDLAATASVVHGDPAALQQVILNLAVNARDAMPGGGEIRISTRSVDLVEDDPQVRQDLSPGRYCEIVVSDTGTGIPPEIRDRIFEPFFTTKDPGKGTGMGLAMVYGTVRDHGGSVDVQSQVGCGSSFRIYLPAAAGNAAGDAEDERGEPICGSGRILVVDNEEIVRQALTGMLESLGYQVTAVGDGDQAIDYYREHDREIDLAIVDLVMPAMSGIECFQALRQVNPQVRVVLSTGYGLTEEAEELLAADQVGVAEKPFGLLRLSQVVAAALKGRP